MVKAVVKAEGAGGVPAGVLEGTFFGAPGAVDRKFGLRVQCGGEEAKQQEREDEESTAIHA